MAPIRPPIRRPSSSVVVAGQATTTTTRRRRERERERERDRDTNLVISPPTQPPSAVLCVLPCSCVFCRVPVCSAVLLSVLCARVRSLNLCTCVRAWWYVALLWYAVSVCLAPLVFRPAQHIKNVGYLINPGDKRTLPVLVRSGSPKWRLHLRHPHETKMLVAIV